MQERDKAMNSTNDPDGVQKKGRAVTHTWGNERGEEKLTSVKYDHASFASGEADHQLAGARGDKPPHITLRCLDCNLYFSFLPGSTFHRPFLQHSLEVTAPPPSCPPPSGTHLTAQKLASVALHNDTTSRTGIGKLSTNQTPSLCVAGIDHTGSSIELLGARPTVAAAWVRGMAGRRSRERQQTRMDTRAHPLPSSLLWRRAMSTVIRADYGSNFWGRLTISSQVATWI
jgi:hypothetical protein